MTGVQTCALPIFSVLQELPCVLRWSHEPVSAEAQSYKLLGASSALLLNALKELAGIDHDQHVISPEALRPIQALN